ncbi:MAG TPA: UDP-2,4-diacetamido-2,4,6-trideoxy-beta-L-altropyranose hydrolase [Stellaceae bacterium]|jgi:UDP-2,4-diacetamido-2,4,6-trideoxy-beta-L-altropyranose hydrolase|nr:UDP-2,4-diacetamido-2,4,6-trideoxy-beta-L-altropyranose hydrolase [Stellaceae bacterium]
MDAARRAIFRTDASVSIGGGHVRRCLVLADALAEAGWEIGFVCSTAARAIVPALGGRGFTLLDPATFDHAAPARCALLVVDDYKLDATFESACRPWAERILVIDDLADRRHDCDVLLDQSPGRSRDAYAGLVPAQCEFLLGPSYALIDPRFRAARRSRKTIGKVERIFVNFGTTDAANASAIALDALDRAKLDAAVDLVLGGAAPHLAALRVRIAGGAPPASVHVDVDDMASLMRRADLAIGAGGVGALERCALGVPSAILTVAPNQIANATALGAAGAALYLGDIGARPAAEIATALQALCADTATRRAMSAAASQLVDGLGAARVRVSCFAPQRAKDGRVVSLRPANFADAADMLAWQSAPGVRRYARNPAAPTPGEHERWLRAKLDDPDCIFNVVLHGDAPVGVLRFDRIAAANALEVSILIAADRQGLGIGSCALELGKQLLAKERICAAIHPGNVASIRLFERAGYRAANPGEWILAPSA